MTLPGVVEVVVGQDRVVGGVGGFPVVLKALDGLGGADIGDFRLQRAVLDGGGGVVVVDPLRIDQGAGVALAVQNPVNDGSLANPRHNRDVFAGPRALFDDG
jgi:hypothetical protein